MPVNCAIPSCRASYKSNPGISMFELPSKPNEVRLQWVNNICRAVNANCDEPPDWIMKDHIRICSRHFTEDDISTIHMKKRLSPSAVPTIFPGIADLTNPFKGKIFSANKRLEHQASSPQPYKQLPRSKVHHISTHSLLYEPTVIIHETETTKSSSSVKGPSCDVAVQVDVVAKTKATRAETKLKRLLRFEKQRTASLETCVRSLKNQNPVPLSPTLVNKMNSIVRASESGNPKAKVLLEKIKNFSV